MEDYDNIDYSQVPSVWNEMITSSTVSKSSSFDLTNNHIIDCGLFNNTNISSEDNLKMDHGMSNIAISCPDGHDVKCDSNLKSDNPNVFSGISALLNRSTSNNSITNHNIPPKQIIYDNNQPNVHCESKSSCDPHPTSSSRRVSASTLCLQLSANNLFGGESSTASSISLSDGLHTPKEGFTMTTFKDFPPPRTSNTPHHDGIDSLSSSYEEKKQSMSISGLKRSSPNDVTSVPENIKHRNPLDTAFINTDTSSQSEPTPSRLYTEFIIDEIIGTGIFGTVYRVRNRKDDHIYAIKRSRRQYRGRQDKNKMLREVDAMQALSKLDDLESIATIVKYVSYWVEDHYVCIQMELCDCSVESMLSAHPVKEPDIYILLHDILLALSTLHQHEYVHLDIKPANIMRKGDRYKLGDFGLTVHTNHGQAASNAIEEGDCRYMARELLDWGPVHDLTKCDIFSLGITAYEVVTHIPSPVNGPQWHALRDGSFVIPSTSYDHSSSQHIIIPEQIVDILGALLMPAPAYRPTAIDCLNQYFLSSSNDPIHQRNFIASLNAKLVDMDHQT